jgi:hypothetical protein
MKPARKDKNPHIKYALTIYEEPTGTSNTGQLELFCPVLKSPVLARSLQSVRLNKILRVHVLRILPLV